MRTLIEWLYKRFPPRLVVTVQDYTELREEVAKYNLIVQGIGQLNERVVALEAQIKRLNDANGFVNTSKGSLRLER